MNENRSTHPKISLGILFIIIVFLFQTKLFAVNAPYLISAQAIDDHRITLSWRNNDIAAEKIVLLRKTASTMWNSIDSIPATIATHTDDLLSPSTEYSYALLAIASGQISDTSNSLSAKTLEKIKIFFIPKINVVRIESNKTIDVNFLDSCNMEKKFRLHRKKIDGAWAVIDSQNNCSPDSMVWRVFHDLTPAGNTWYSYKVEAYNASLTAFSPETTVYNYLQPDNNQKYTISLLSSFPANPVSWNERIGDSLFFPEKLPQGDTQIAIIDISKPQSPQFKSYFKQSAIPVALKNSVVDTRINLHPGNLFFKPIKGYYFILIDSTLFQYDSTTQALRDSIKFHVGFDYTRGFSKGWFAGSLGDSCFILGCETRPYSGTQSILYPVIYGLNGIDTLANSIRWRNGGTTGHYYGGGSLGCIEKKIVFNTYEGGMNRYDYKFNFFDFSHDISKPLFFNITDSINKFTSGNSNVVFDKHTTIHYGQATNGLGINFFNISDAYSGPNRSIGMLLDTTFKSTSIVSISLDTTKNQFIVFGNSAISLYSYSKLGVNINFQAVLKNYNSNKIKIIQSLHNICFNHSLPEQLCLEIFDIKGRNVRQISALPQKPLFWDKKDFSGRYVGAGLYVFRIRAKGSEHFSGSLMIAK